jgi:hypothetical protein
MPARESRPTSFVLVAYTAVATLFFGTLVAKDVAVHTPLSERGLSIRGIIYEAVALTRVISRLVRLNNLIDLIDCNIIEVECCIMEKNLLFTLSVVGEADLQSLRKGVA